MENIYGKNVIVFGGAGGMSMEINKALLKNGISNLVLSDIQEHNQELKDLMNNHRNIFYEKGSVADKDFVVSVFKKYFDQLGYIDILINAAGILNETQVDLTIQINALGPMYSCIEALKYMGKNKGGRGGLIINIASVAGLMARSASLIYCTSKHALVGFSRCLMDDQFFQLTGIKVHVLCPGGTETPMLNDRHKGSFLPELEEVMENMVKTIILQPPSKVAEGVMTALQDDSNGAVWISDNGKTYKVEMPEIFKFEMKN